MMTTVKQNICSCQHGALMRQARWSSGLAAGGNVEVTI